VAQRRARTLRRGLVLVVAAALLAGCTWGDGGSTATSTLSPSGPPSAAARRAGRIVFSTAEDIYVVNGDGTGLRQLTTGPAAEFDPSWSPDGRRIAYRVDSGPAAADIFVMNADGSGQRRIASGLSPAWSPDGAMIAYADDQGSFAGALAAPPGWPGGRLGVRGYRVGASRRTTPSLPNGVPLMLPRI
jgi:dipeptidyl aminopeptidase/acylaminoacyl peptidase